MPTCKRIVCAGHNSDCYQSFCSDMQVTQEGKQLKGDRIPLRLCGVQRGGGGCDSISGFLLPLNCAYGMMQMDWLDRSPLITKLGVAVKGIKELCLRLQWIHLCGKALGSVTHVSGRPPASLFAAPTLPLTLLQVYPLTPHSSTPPLPWEGARGPRTHPRRAGRCSCPRAGRGCARMRRGRARSPASARSGPPPRRSCCACSAGAARCHSASPSPGSPGSRSAPAWPACQSGCGCCRPAPGPRSRWYSRCSASGSRGAPCAAPRSCRPGTGSWNCGWAPGRPSASSRRWPRGPRCPGFLGHCHSPAGTTACRPRSMQGNDTGALFKMHLAVHPCTRCSPPAREGEGGRAFRVPKS